MRQNTSETKPAAKQLFPSGLQQCIAAVVVVKVRNNAFSTDKKHNIPAVL